MNENPMNTLGALLAAFTLTLATGAAVAKSEPDPYYLPQPDQPYQGKVETRIGTLEFENQYPTKKSMDTILDSMDFQGATQAFLWGIPIASFANLQYYLHQDFKFDQTEFFVFDTLPRISISAGTSFRYKQSGLRT
jgi:hypothetical protein